MNKSTISHVISVVVENINMADKDDFYKLKWCHCKKCYTMTTRVDEKCCSEAGGAVCITEIPSFKEYVDKELTADKLDIMIGIKHATWAYTYQLGSQADRRRKSYQLLKNWKDIPDVYNINKWATNLPSCVKWCIRNKFQETSGLYTGYYPDSGLNSRSYSYFQ